MIAFELRIKLAQVPGRRAGASIPSLSSAVPTEGGHENGVRAEMHFIVAAGQMADSAAAFGLVEILIVVVILGILAAIAVPKFSNASQI